MLSNLKGAEGKISPSDICEFYKQMFLRDLKRKFPTEEFEGNTFDYSRPNHLDISKISNKTIKKRFFLKPWKKYAVTEKVLESLVSISFTNIFNSEEVNHNWISLYSPMFLSACSKTLDKLNKIFERTNRIQYNYRIDLTKIPEINSSL